MKWLGIKSAWIVVFLVWSGAGTWAGGLDAPAAPSSADSALYTLTDIYNRLNAGTAGIKRRGAFSEPTSGPAPSTVTTDEIMSVAPAVNEAGALDAQVLEGMKYWGLTANDWGMRTGTMVNRGSPTLMPGTFAQTLMEGYYSGGTVHGSANLTAENIKKDVAIFGVMGTYEGSSEGSIYPTSIRKTGQTVSYRTGDNGDIQQGVVWPNPRFTDNGDETVTDNLTGLMWAKNANLPNAVLTWNDAIDYCSSLGHAGYADWRLPNVLELLSLVHWGCNGPAVPNTAGTDRWSASDPFVNVWSTEYWSSTTVNGGEVNAWHVHLNRGIVHTGNKTLTYRVWPVRGGL